MIRGSFGFLAFVFAFGVSTAFAHPGHDHDAPAKLTFRWTSVAGFLLDDGETTLSFDPIFTRPGVLNWMGVKELTPDDDAITENLNALGVGKIDAIFVSHEHFDHVVDAADIAHRFGATLYGGPSLERIAIANAKRSGWNDLRFRKVEDREWITVGKFRIKFIRRDHAAIFPKIGFHFLSGPVPEDFHFGFYQYYDGEVWCWLVEHPSGRIYVDQGSNFFEGVKESIGSHIDTMFLGITNKKSVEDWVSKYIVQFTPKLVIPLHFDFFFGPVNREHMRRLPGTNYESLVSESAKVSPGTKFRMPKFGERITIE